MIPPKLANAILSLVVHCDFFVRSEASVRPPQISYRLAHTGSGHESYVAVSEEASSTGTKDDILPRNDLGTSNNTQSKMKGMTKQLAYSVFFDFNEKNLHESQPIAFFSNWSENSHDKYFERLATHPDLTLPEFFVEDMLGWPAMKCDPKIGCSNIPTLDVISARHSQDRFLARRIHHFVILLNAMHTETGVLMAGMKNTRENMQDLCLNFAKTFFHKAEKSHRAACITYTLWAMTIITMGVMTFGTAAAFAAAFGGEPGAWGGHLWEILNFGIPLGTAVAITGINSKVSKRAEAMRTREEAIQALQAVIHTSTSGLFGGRESVIFGRLLAKLEHVLAPNGLDSSISGPVSQWTAHQATETLLLFLTQQTDEMIDNSSELGYLLEKLGTKLSPETSVKSGSNPNSTPPTSPHTSPGISPAIFGLVEEISIRDVTSTHGSLAENAAHVHGHLLDALASAPIRLGIIHEFGGDRSLDHSDPDVLRRFIAIGELPQSSQASFDFDHNVQWSAKIAKYANKLRDPDFRDQYSFPPVTDRSSKASSRATQNPTRNLTMTKRDNLGTTLVQTNLQADWLSLVGNWSLHGVATTPEAPTSWSFVFDVNPSHNARLSRRNTAETQRARAIFAQGLGVHNAISVIESGRAHGFMTPSDHGSMKERADGVSDWSVEQATDADNEFSIDVRHTIFTNDIQHGLCDNNRYTGNTIANEQKCKLLTKQATEEVSKRLETSLRNAVQPKARDWPRESPAPLAEYMQRRFRSFPNIGALAYLKDHPDILMARLTEILKSNLITKAWADEHCYMRCSPKEEGLDGLRGYHELPDGRPCVAGCYTAHYTFDDVYGMEDEALETPWSLNYHNVKSKSWERYKKHDRTTFLTGSFSMDPVGKENNDKSPTIPVCDSFFPIKLGRIKEYLPCTCGDVYGNESLKFWQMSDWASEGTLSDAVRKCRNLLEPPLAKNSPGAYLINMCQVYFHLLFPRSSIRFRYDNDHHRKNLNMCDNAMQYYERNKQDESINMDKELCKIWGANYKTSHNNHRKHQNFHNINHDLRYGGCRKYIHHL